MKIKAILLVIVAALFAFPAAAQTQPTNTTTVGYNNFSFSVDAAWANHIDIHQFPGDETTVEQPGGPEVKHVEFLISDSATTESMYDASLAIRVYHTADFAAYPAQQASLDQLQNLINGQIDLNAFSAPTLDDGSNTLPFLPVMPASQVIRSRTHYIDTAEVRGISYVTAYRQDASPFVANDFYYTFQGISTDGQYYVSVIGRPTIALFPTEIEADFDYNTFAETIVDYTTQTIAALNAALETDFTPTLSSFDTVVMSFDFADDGMLMPVEPTLDPAAPVPTLDLTVPTVDPAAPTLDPAVPTVEATSEPTMGGLGNVTWTLTGYGAVDAPIAPLPEAPVVMSFTTEQGLAGTAGCNSFSGPFTFDGTTIGIGPLVSTLMACDEPVMTQEMAVMTALQTATSFELLDGQLRITYPEGVLVFSAGAA